MDSKVYNVSVSRKKTPLYQSLIAFLLIVLAFWGVTTNSDWGGYEYWFSVDASGSDEAFAFLSAWFNERGLTFRMLYRFHILLIAFFYVLLFRKLRVNPIVFSIIMLLFSYDALGNQIRYFVGLPMALLALYYYVEKKYLWAALFGVFAFFFHSSLVLFFAVFFFYYHFLRHLGITWRVVAIIVANLALYYVVHNTNISTSFSDNYETYLTSTDRISSIAGGVYNMFTSFIYIFFAGRINSQIIKLCPAYAKNDEYQYLYTCIMMGTVLILCSIPTQIIATRMMNMAIMPIWLTYFLRAKDLNVRTISRQVTICLIAIFLFRILHAFGVFTGSDSYIYHIREMLNSYTF